MFTIQKNEVQFYETFIPVDFVILFCLYVHNVYRLFWSYVKVEHIRLLIMQMNEMYREVIIVSIQKRENLNNRNF